MANNKNQSKKEPVSFDDMIQADRKKRKAEELAQKIFGKDRRQSAPTGAHNNRKAPALGGSLASRVGVNKRSASTVSVDHSSNSNSNNNKQNRRNGRQSQLATENRAAAVQAAVQQKTQMPVLRQRSFAANGDDNEISIRGAAGPYCVVASNFVTGTTAADIESVMAPVGGEMGGCRLISSSPTVIAEMLFLDRSGADNVINMFNGKKADGRILYVYLKEGGPSQPMIVQPPVAPRIPSPVVFNPPEPIQQEVQDEIMEIDQPYSVEKSPLPHNDPTPRDHLSPRPSYSRPPNDRPSYRQDYDRGPRHADSGYQDGRYGFPDQRYDSSNYDRPPRYPQQGRMYSDDMMRGGRRGGRGQRYR